MRKSYIFRDGKFIEISKVRPTAHLHNVQQDTMEPARHPANGQMYDSKSAFRRVTKAYGLEEKGEEPARVGRDPHTVRQEERHLKKEISTLVREMVDRRSGDYGDYPKLTVNDVFGE